MSKKSIAKIDQIFNVFSASMAEIRPHFILTGPSGSGKSFNVLELVEKHNLCYFEINAAQLTREGLSGNSLSKAMAPLANFGNRPVVCFMDEFDKLFISGNSNSDLAHEATNGVQNEVLKMLESRTTAIFGDYGKYREVTVDNVLFVFAGAFNGEENLTLDRLQQMGLKTELLGRVGIVLNLEKIELQTLKDILEKSELLAKYLELFVDVRRDDVIRSIWGIVEEEYEQNTIGARFITGLTHKYFLNGGVLREAEEVPKVFPKKLQISPPKF